MCQHFIRPGATILCCLGEIDIQVHVFKQTEAQYKSFQEIVDGILQEYCLFLKKLKSQGYSVYCGNPLLPRKTLALWTIVFPETAPKRIVTAPLHILVKDFPRFVVKFFGGISFHI